MEAALGKETGDFVKVEYLSNSAKGVPTLELELRDANGVEHEFMCDATTGQIYQAETEVDKPSDLKFVAKVSEKAMAIAIKAHPGEVVEVEYEIEPDGGSTYDAGRCLLPYSPKPNSSDALAVHLCCYEH